MFYVYIYTIYSVLVFLLIKFRMKMTIINLGYHTIFVLNKALYKALYAFVQFSQYRTCTFRHPKDLEVVPHPKLLDIVLVTNRV